MIANHPLFREEMQRIADFYVAKGETLLKLPFDGVNQ